ncbi:MAG: UDP-N-acetylmuramoylalanine--D-glutamate ligase [Sphaerochaetaceae bacterium]|nr:UDP-N-acetylmuramoylalanine--D-glutamate ligase [Sphaerochaetaceae bacterium]
MNVLIFGYGLYGGGFASASYFLKKGHSVRLTDFRDESSLGDGVVRLKSMGVDVIAGCHRTEDFKWADIVVKTPAISPENEFLKFAKKQANDFSCLFSDSHVKDVKLVCITGTKGKTVTSSAVCSCLNSMGFKARMCGNMGISPFAELALWEQGDVPQYLVCEFSAWQVRDTYRYLDGKMPEIEISMFTNVLDCDSSDFTGDRETDVGEKIKMFGSSAKKLLCPYEVTHNVAKIAGLGRKSIYSSEYAMSGFSKELPLNLRNAYAVLRRMGFSQGKVNMALKSFKGVPHRAELVTRRSNLIVVNDSAATIPAAVSFSFANFNTMPVHLICGGTGKNLDGSEMLDVLKSSVSVHLLDGNFTRQSLIPLLDEKHIKYYGPYEKIEDAVSGVMSSVSDCDVMQVVLLSPGAQAYEFFSNEFERGDRFRNCFIEPVS